MREINQNPVKLKCILRGDQKIKINVDKEGDLLLVLDQRMMNLNFGLIIIL